MWQLQYERLAGAAACVGHATQVLAEVAAVRVVQLALEIDVFGEDANDGARRACRDLFRERRLLDRILPDIDAVLGIGADENPSMELTDSDPALPAPLWSLDAGEASEEA